MKTYIISLENPTEKINYLKSHGISPILIEGINGKKEKDENIEKHVSTYYKYFGPKSAIGCALSHIKAWRAFLETADDYAIIFEDDVVVEDDFVNKLNLAMSHVPSSFDVLYLGCLGCDNDQSVNMIKWSMFMIVKPVEPKKINDYISIPSVAFATHAYVLSRKGAETLLKEIDGKLNNHIDICMQQLASNGKIETYVTTPRIAYQTSTDNGISANVSSNHPILLSKFLNQFYFDKMTRANYFFNVSILRLGEINVNMASILFLFLGLVLVKVDIKKITLFYILLSLPDICLVRSKNDILLIIFHYFLLILPTLIKHVYKYNAEHKH